VISLSDQLDMFKKYKNKINEAIGEERMNMIISKSVYIICIGSDDIANTYTQTPYRRFNYDIPSYTDLLATHSSNFLQVYSVIQTKTLSPCFVHFLAFTTSLNMVTTHKHCHFYLLIIGSVAQYTIS
jgi:hypothetical protein